MSLGILQMRKQGEANWDDGWEWVVPSTNAQVVISLFEIKGPEVNKPIYNCLLISFFFPFKFSSFVDCSFLLFRA